jgi:Sodium:solute symporter family.
MFMVNLKSNFFGSFFSVWVSGFVINFTLVCQPHIMSKTLYMKNNHDVHIYLTITILISIMFSSLLLINLFTRVLDLPTETIIDPITNLVHQNHMITVYLTKTFNPSILTIITITILATNINTLDNILVALSNITTNDLFLDIAHPTLTKKN